MPDPDAPDRRSETRPASAELIDLLEKALRRKDAAANPNTRRAYTHGIRSFASFCEAHGLEACPARPEAVIAWMEQLANLDYAFATIDSYLAAVTFLHREQGEEDPCSADAVTRHRQHLRRTMDLSQEQKEPLLLEDLLEMLETLDDTKLASVRDRAVLLVGFAGAFRRSELAGLDVGDVSDIEGGTAYHLGQSKTDQAGQGRVVQIPDDTRFPSPNRALERWQEAGEVFSGPLFRPIDRWENVGDTRLTGRSVSRIVKRGAERIGRDPSEYGAHSLRAGFLTQGYLNGIGDHELAQVTGHASFDVLRGYQRVAIVMDDHPVSRMGIERKESTPADL